MDDLNPDEKKVVIDALTMHKEVIEKKSQLMTENPEMKETEALQKAREIIAKNNGLKIDEVKEFDELGNKIEEYITELQIGVDNEKANELWKEITEKCKELGIDDQKRDTMIQEENENLEKYSKVKKNKDKISDLSTEEEKKSQGDSEKLADLLISDERQIKENNESIISEIEFEEDKDLTDLLTMDEKELEENNISDLFKIDDNDISKLFMAEENEDKQPINKDKKKFVNSILTGADENDLKQEDYIMEIDENKGLWNKIKNRFSKIKESITKVFGFNVKSNKSLKGQALLNGTQGDEKGDEGQADGTTNPFEVGDEFKAKIIKVGIEAAAENKDRNSRNGNLNIKVASNEEISL